jgi:hypothetical protein
MSNLAKLMGAVVLIGAVSAVFVPPEVEPEVRTPGLSEAEKADVISWITARPEVHDAAFTGSDWLYIGVRPGEKEWVAYTAGVCRQLRLRGVSGVPAVKAVDIAYVRARRGFEEIAKAYCE